MTVPLPTIAYLAPALTALEATFVYDELLAIERLGFSTVPVSVHRSKNELIGHDELLGRTYYLYEGGFGVVLAQSLCALALLPGGRFRGFRLLVKDVLEIGLFGKQSWKLAYQYLVAARLAQILIRHKCRHLHVHFAHVPAQIAMYSSAMSGVTFTVMAHANDIFERGLLLPQKAMRALKMLTISEYNRAFLESIGVSGEKLAVVRCGVSFAARNSKAMFERKTLYRIGTLGRLVEKKGMDVVIGALAELRRGHPGIQIEIAGSGPQEEALKQLAVALGVAENVRFLGNLPHSGVQQWMQDLDVFVLACRPDTNGDMDGIPVVLMEAMSQCVPVVSTRLSGIPELVVDGVTGLLAASGDSCDLAGQISRLLQSELLRESLANEALKHVQREFGQETNVRRLLRHFGLDGTDVAVAKGWQP